MPLSSLWWMDGKLPRVQMSACSTVNLCPQMQWAPSIAKVKSISESHFVEGKSMFGHRECDKPTGSSLFFWDLHCSLHVVTQPYLQFCHCCWVSFSLCYRFLRGCELLYFSFLVVYEGLLRNERGDGCSDWHWKSATATWRCNKAQVPALTGQSAHVDTSKCEYTIFTFLSSAMCLALQKKWCSTECTPGQAWRLLARLALLWQTTVAIEAETRGQSGCSAWYEENPLDGKHSVIQLDSLCLTLSFIAAGRPWRFTCTVPHAPKPLSLRSLKSWGEV